MKRTQMNRVISYIEENGYITRVQAMNDIGVANLTAVISDLRVAGAPIVTQIVEAKNRYGEDIRYARYYLSGDAR